MPVYHTGKHSSTVASFPLLSRFGCRRQTNRALCAASLVQALLGHRTQSSVSLSVVRGIYTAANACYHDRLTSETTVERVSRLQQMSVHQRDRQTGRSDYQGEESQYSTTDWHPRLRRRRGIKARPHSEEMHDRLGASKTTEERDVGYSNIIHARGSGDEREQNHFPYHIQGAVGGERNRERGWSTFPVIYKGQWR